MAVDARWKVGLTYQAGEGRPLLTRADCGAVAPLAIYVHVIHVDVEVNMAVNTRMRVWVNLPGRRGAPTVNTR